MVKLHVLADSSHLLGHGAINETLSYNEINRQGINYVRKQTTLHMIIKIS